MFRCVCQQVIENKAMFQCYFYLRFMKQHSELFMEGTLGHECVENICGRGEGKMLFHNIPKREHYKIFYKTILNTIKL